MGKRTLIFFLAVLLVVLGQVGFTQAEEGVTDTEIHVAQFGPLTGPAKMWGGCLLGPKLVFGMVNDKGGVHGRKIVYHTVDDSYNPAKTKAGVKRLQETIGIFAWFGGVGTAPGQAVKNYLVKRKIPWVGPISGSEDWVNPPKRTIFAMFPHYTFSAKVLCDYAVKEMGKERVAIVYLNDGFGQSGLQGARQALAAYNMEFAAAIPVERNSSDMTSITLQLRNVKADTVILWVDPFKALRIISVAKTMNFAPLYMSGAMLGDFPQMYRLSKGLIEGMITTNYAEYKNKGLIDKYKQALKKYVSPDAEWTLPVLAGVGYSMVFLEGLKRSGPNLTRDRFIKAMENLRNFVPMGAPVTFKPFDANDPSCRYGTNTVYLQQCQADGKTFVLTDWIYP